MARKKATEEPREAPATPAAVAAHGEAVSEVQAAGAALLIVDESGGVIRSAGWDRLFGMPAPERIPAVEGEDDDALLGGVARALQQAEHSGHVAHTYVMVSFDRKRRYAISAGPIGRNGDRHAAAGARSPGGRATAVLVGDISDSYQVSPHEGEVVRQLAHDLRTPLTSLGGAVELMQSGRLGGLNPEQERLLGIMQKGIDLMLTRINEAAAPFRRAAGLEVPDPDRPAVS